jgi:hypothetical protein
MTFARLSTQRDRVLQVVELTPDREWILWDVDDGLVSSVGSRSESVEVCCDACGDWTSSVESVSSSWHCVGCSS